MAQAGREERPPDVGDGRLVSRTREIDDCSFRAFLSAQSAPRVAWATPDGLELAGGGAAAVVRAAGDGRFDALRADANELFADIDIDGPPPARLRHIADQAAHSRDLRSIDAPSGPSVPRRSPMGRT